MAPRKGHDGSTTSEELCTSPVRSYNPRTPQLRTLRSFDSHAPHSSDTTAPSRPQASTRATVRGTRSGGGVFRNLRVRKRIHIGEMKKRPFQRNVGQKRFLASQKTSTPIAKRRARAHVNPAVPHEDRTSPVPQRNSNASRSEDDRPTVIDLGNYTSGTQLNSARTAEQPHTATADSHLTSDGIVELLKASEKRVLKHVVSQQRLLLIAMEKLEALVKDIPDAVCKLNNDVADLKLMVLPASDGYSSNRNTSRSCPSNRTKDAALRQEVLEANPTLLAELHIVFKTDVGSVSAATAIAEQMLKFHRASDVVSISSRCMNIFFYGLQKDKKKSEFKEGVGFKHAEFRFKIARFMLERAKELPERLFSVQEVGAGDGRLEAELRANRKPCWLTSNLVDHRAMTLARKHHECLRSELPPDPSAPDKRKALFIAKSLFSNVIGMLRYSREKARIRMFEDGNFCLIDWESLKWFPRDLRNPELSFVRPGKETVPVSSISETVVGDDSAHENSEILRTVISEQKDMLVEAIYDVHVTEVVDVEGTKKERTVTKRLRRVINILRIAKSFVCSFCHMSEQDVLKTHSSMLQVMYGIALVIRDMFDIKIYGDSLHLTGIGGNNTIRGGNPAAADEADGNPTHNSPSRTDDAIGGEGLENQNHETHVSTPTERHATAQNNGDRLAGRSDPREGRGGSGNRHGGSGNRKKTPPINIKGLMPADSEKDMILHNILNLNLEAYNKLRAHYEAGAEVTAENSGFEGNASSDQEVPGLDQDSDHDYMSDMYED